MRKATIIGRDLQVQRCLSLAVLEAPLRDVSGGIAKHKFTSSFIDHFQYLLRNLWFASWIGLVWRVIAFVLVLVYFAYVHRVYKGK